MLRPVHASGCLHGESSWHSGVATQPSSTQASLNTQLGIHLLSLAAMRPCTDLRSQCARALVC